MALISSECFDGGVSSHFVLVMEQEERTGESRSSSGSHTMSDDHTAELNVKMNNDEDDSSSSSHSDFQCVNEMGDDGTPQNEHDEEDEDEKVNTEHVAEKSLKLFWSCVCFKANPPDLQSRVLTIMNDSIFEETAAYEYKTVSSDSPQHISICVFWS